MKPNINDGLAVYEQLRGAERAGAMRAAVNSDAFGAAMTGLSMDFVFGKVWGRDGLDRRARSLVTLGILIALRQRDELKNHVEIALKNGLTRHELEEVMIQACSYAGFPAARVASVAAKEVLDDLHSGGGDPL